MKFTDGYWGIRKGIEPHFAASAIEAEQRENELTVYAPGRQIRHRTDTLNMPLLTVRYSSPMRNVIRVKISHFEGGVDRGPRFQLESNPADSAYKSNIRITEKEAVLESGELSVSIEQGQNWNNVFRAGGKVLTKNLSKSN
jgi:alpha-D-xyloside xylohydrolase